MMTPNKDTRAFVERHGIRVIDTNKRAARFNKINVELFKYNHDYNMINAFTAYDTEPLYTVEITESELDRIASFEEQVFNNMAEKGHYNMFETLMQQKEREQYLKKKYPAVKKAYEQYSLMLKLAQSGETTNEN
jgi:hypothetical protein